MNTLLSDKFLVEFKNRTAECCVNLTNSEISFYPLKSNDKLESHYHTISLDDVFGCRLQRKPSVNRFYCCNSKDLSNETTAYLCLYIYASSKSTGKLSSKQLRFKRRVVYFGINQVENLNDNLKIGEKWQNAILFLIREEHDGNINDSILEIKAPKRTYLLFINPVSGPGKAMEIFDQKVSRLFYECDIDYHLEITDQANSARSFIEKTADLVSKFDGIVVISGDGLLFEIINGIMKRSDWQSLIKIPIGIIPGGSGNGLAHSINYFITNEISSDPVLAAALNVVRCKPVPLDLVKINTQKEVIFSFLSIGWGLMADIDIESERLRFMGEPRFTIWALYRTLMLRKYRGKLTYLPSLLDKTPKTEDFTSKDQHSGNNKHFDFQSQRKKVFPSVDFNNDGCSVDPIENSNDWVVIEDEFVMVYASHLTHLNSSCFYAPLAKPNDGIIWLVVINGNVARTQILQFLLAMENGSHVDLPFVHVIPVKAFMLEPYMNQGKLTVDGELIDCGPIHAQIMPSVARIMTR